MAGPVVNLLGVDPKDWYDLMYFLVEVFGEAFWAIIFSIFH